MSAINETITTILDNTISCSVTPNDALLRFFALLGLLSVGGIVFSSIGKNFMYPLIYIWGFIVWVYNKIRGRTI